MLREILCIFLFSAFMCIYGVAQNEGYITLQGIVRNHETKEALAVASIRISRSSIGTHSDAKGRFSLNIPQSNRYDSLIVTFVGYKKYSEILSNLANLTDLQIDLASHPTNLKEVGRFSPKDIKTFYRVGCARWPNEHFQILIDEGWIHETHFDLRKSRYGCTAPKFHFLLEALETYLRRAQGRLSALAVEPASNDLHLIDVICPNTPADEIRTDTFDFFQEIKDQR
jgi:hypothetical protein